MRGFLHGAAFAAMWSVGVAEAQAGCTASPPASWVKQQTVGTDTPLHVFSNHGTAAEQANRFRIRGPDSALLPIRAEALGVLVQFLPEEAWPDGSITVEERGFYDSDGTRTKAEDAPHQGWFALAQLDVVDAPERLSAPSGVEWTRTDWSGGAKVGGRLWSPAGARWVDLEVEGVGPIHRHSLVGGPMMLRTARNSRCSVFGGLQPIPADGDVTVRMVAHGDGGAVAAGPWVTLGPGGGEPIGTPSDTQHLQTWTRIARGAPPGETVTNRGSCPSLAVVDGEEQLRPVGVRLDEASPGTRLPLGDRTVVVGLVANSTWWWVEDADGVASAPLPASGRSIRVGDGGDGVPDGVVEVAHLRYAPAGQARVEVRERYTCTDVVRGLPARWEGR